MSLRHSLALAASLLVLTPAAQAAQADEHRLSCASGMPDTASSPIAPFKKHADADALNVVGLTTDGRLVCFNERRPSRLQLIGTVSGLQMDTRLVGIDFRVQDGLLYGVGDAGGVYMLDTGHAQATLVNRLSVALSGNTFGVDFNPVADRLRIVSDTGQNLRHNVNAGGVTLLDGALNYTAGTSALGVAGAAYTNNDLSPATPATTGTTLFVLDAALDQIALQSPPNNGSLVPTGKLTVDSATLTGFDIYSVVRGGVTVRNRALATLSAADGSVRLYDINLLTGKATARGTLPSALTVMDIAVPLAQD